MACTVPSLPVLAGPGFQVRRSAETQAWTRPALSEPSATIPDGAHAVPVNRMPSNCEGLPDWPQPLRSLVEVTIADPPTEFGPQAVKPSPVNRTPVSDGM